MKNRVRGCILVKFGNRRSCRRPPAPAAIAAQAEGSFSSSVEEKGRKKKTKERKKKKKKEWANVFCSGEFEFIFLVGFWFISFGFRLG